MAVPQLVTDLHNRLPPAAALRGVALLRVLFVAIKRPYRADL